VNREEKARVIEELTEKLKGGSVILVDYQGINVAQSTRLRTRSRESGIEFVVAKNTLAQLASRRSRGSSWGRRRWRSARTRSRARS
jgi:large subunit ribosomal protein L10